MRLRRDRGFKHKNRLDDLAVEDLNHDASVQRSALSAACPEVRQTPQSATIGPGSIQAPLTVLVAFLIVIRHGSFIKGISCI